MQVHFFSAFVGKIEDNGLIGGPVVVSASTGIHVCCVFIHSNSITWSGKKRFF